MQSDQTIQAGTSTFTRLARDERDLQAAQRLRYKVFVGEMGATGDQINHDQQLECDAFDPLFDHLLLIDPKRDPDALDHVVGVYRLLRGARLGSAGRFYCDDEFDLSALKTSGRNLLELGRTCLHPDYRGGTALLQLWQGLARYVEAYQIDVLFGAASFQGADVAAHAEALSWMHHHYLAPTELRTTSKTPAAFFPIEKSLINQPTALRAIPSLIKSYLRMGAVIGDGVFVDHAFKTTDICIIVDTAALGKSAKTFAPHKTQVPR